MRPSLNAEKRDKTTRSAIRELRAGGRLPGVVYGNRAEALSVHVSMREIQSQLRTGGSELFDLEIGDKNQKLPVMVAAVQRDSLSGELIHIDFQQVAVDQPVKMKVSIEYVGTSPGTKLGGVMQVQEFSVEVEGLPDHIPAAIEVDVSNLEVGDKLFASDIALAEGLTLLTSEEQLLVSVSMPRGAKDSDTEEAEAEAQTEAE